MPCEFDIIENYFSRNFPGHSAVQLGIGDDAAITTVPQGMEQVIAIDTLVEGVHFSADTSPEAIAWKALAVNLSDLAAMGATPAWFTLALTLPAIDEAWLSGFSHGLSELANSHSIALVGGDTTRGPLTVSIQVAGFVPGGKALLRSGARAGDRVFVTGFIGDGIAGLEVQKAGVKDDNDVYLLGRLQKPQPRVAFGQSLLGIASSCIDISDGLLADLNHLLDASGAGARIQLEHIPLSPACEASRDKLHLSLSELASGGDDYELCFTVPENKVAMLSCTCEELGLAITEIGIIEGQPGLRCFENMQPVEINLAGYQHF